MIRFLLLLLLLPGAELLANDTYEVETFTTTTLGSQFTMAVTPQTSLRKPSGSRAPTKKNTAAKNGKMHHPPPVDNIMTDGAQPAQGGEIVNTTHLKHKNSTHDISSTQNITHWHPTKMPVTAKSHPPRESNIKRPIIKKVPTPPSKPKSMMKTTMRNPSARYQSPPHGHHKNVTIRPGIGHSHDLNASAGGAELAKTHQAVTPLRTTLKLDQKDVSPVASGVKQLPLGSQLNKQLKDKVNTTSVLLSTVINDSPRSVTHNINHITHTLPNSSFVHRKKTVLYKLNALNTSEHVPRAEVMSLVPQIDQSTLGLLKGINLLGASQSGVMQKLNSKVNVRVPDRNVIYNHTKQNLRDTTELFGLGQDGTDPDKTNRVSSTEPVEIGTVTSGSIKRTSDTRSVINIQSGEGEGTQVQTLQTTTQAEVQPHNIVEQQYQTLPELTTVGHMHHNQTHSHKHHKHPFLGEHKQSDNTVSEHTITSSGRSGGTNKHHHRHLHNFTHPHEHNEHWVQHQISSAQVSLDLPSQSPLHVETTDLHERQATIKNGSDTDASVSSYLIKNISEPETSTPSALTLFTTLEPNSTNQSLQNLTTVSQLTTQAQQVFTTLHQPKHKTGPHKLNSLEEDSLLSPSLNMTIKPVTQKHLPTESITYNTTEEFPMELITQTQSQLTSQLTTQKITEATVHGSQKITILTELTTQSQLKVKETQPGEPTQSQPDLTTHSPPYESTRIDPDLTTENQYTRVRIGSSTEPLPNSSPITETHSHLFGVTEPLLTTHSPQDLVTMKNFNETRLSKNNQYSESRTPPGSSSDPITHGYTELLTQTDSVLNKTQLTSQTEPITKGKSESNIHVTNTQPFSWTEKEPTTKGQTEPNTEIEQTKSSQMYSITQKESIAKTTTSWLEKTHAVSLLETEPNTTHSSSTSPLHKEVTTESYTELPTQRPYITKGTTELTGKPRRSSTTPSRTLVKNETDSVPPKTKPLNQTTTIGYGRDETEFTEQTETTSKITLNPITPFGGILPTHRGHLQSTQTQPDVETQTYPQHTTRAGSELTPTTKSDVQTAKEDLTSVLAVSSVSYGHGTSHTTEEPGSDVSSSPSLTGGRQNKDGRWDSGSTLPSNVSTFHPTRSHTSGRDRGLTTAKSSSTEMKLMTSPQSNMFSTQTLGEVMSAEPGRDRIFIVDEQQPVFKVQTINVTYKMRLTHHAACEQLDSCRPLLLQELTAAYKSTPGFDKIEILNVTTAGTVLEYKVLFCVRPGSLMSATQEVVLSNPSMLFGSSKKPLAYRIYNTTLLDNHADPCTDWFACPRSFQCVPLRKFSALCLSPCHSIFCHNNGICIHRKGQDPECQCPIGRDFWYMGQTCDYRMTHHRLAAIACAVVFCIIICAAAAVFILVRRFQTQILQQKVAQTQSSYRRFSRFDDVPTHFWCPSQTWLTASASLNSLDNPAFSSSEEVFPLQALGSCVCGCQDGARSVSQSNQPQQAARAQPRLETSCSSVNDLMIDSGKASDVSVCSWPMEPIHWTPFPILHQLSLQSPFHARRPHSYFEGMELVNTERSWTA
ncbi:mucin-4-like [Bufo gargarizans]|uniref:mucin-4-like n=1 Tax=Bufo gargarizans TaxID=30331 RepID=UPI001CF5AF35|nr:mucin-4-like [Bufo gargarizans]